MLKEDEVRLRHMLDASKEATLFMQGETRLSLERNRMLLLSLIRSIEIIGEAAAQVTKEFQKAHEEIPWSEIIAMRNQLIHAYFDVDSDRIWDTVKDDLPRLIAELENLLK